MAGPAKRLMDVEELVRWACGQELPKKRGSATWRAPAEFRSAVPRRESSLLGRWNAPAGYPEISPMFAHGFASPNLSGRGGSPDDDAILVEAAILGLSLGNFDFDAEELSFGIGLPVDVEGAFASAAANVSNLLLTHGKLGNRPSLGDGQFAIGPKLAPNGKPGVWRIEAEVAGTFGGGDVTREFEAPVVAMKRRHLYPDGAYGVLVYNPDPQEIVNDRAVYLAWRMGLDLLGEALSRRMERITAVPTAAAMMPWRGDLDGDPVRDLFGAGAGAVRGPLEVARMSGDRALGARRRLSVGGALRGRKPARPGKSVAAG
jgi:hypothetical protein